jgi:hypothetical protein
MKAWRETNRTIPIDNEWVLIDTKQIGYIMEDQWYLAHDDSPIATPFMWMPIPLLPND